MKKRVLALLMAICLVVGLIPISAWATQNELEVMANIDGALEQIPGVYGGHTYALFDGVASTWDEAKEYCESLGGHLATITSAEENAFLYEYMLECGYSDAYWGFSDHAVEGVWEWCTGEPVTYLNWASGEPNDDYDSEEDYGMFWYGKSGGVWNDGVFGDDGYAFLCEWDYLNSVDTNAPIIIVPGIMGSRLFTSDTTFNDSTRVWDPVLPDKLASWDTVSALLKLNESVEGNLYPRPCENQQNYEEGTGSAQAYGREYGAQNTYKKTVDTLCKNFPNRAVYVFSYDWRKSNDYSASLLAEEINRISQEHGSKVDLVCHSMGGLVASSYFAQYGSERVDKIITCGTPYEGAPKLLNSVLTTQVLDKTVTNIALSSLGGLSSETKASFDGVAQLTPTYRYIQKFPVYKDHWAPFGWHDYEISYLEYVHICADIFGDSRFIDAMEFQRSIRTNNSEGGNNVLYDYGNAYFVIGKNHPTISSIKFQLTTNGVDETFTESDLSYTFKGDGTVPFYSASIGERLSDGNRCLTADVNHTQTITNSKCLEWITDILRNGASPVESDANYSSSFITMRVACPVDVTISQGDEVLSYDSINQTVSAEASFGRMDLIGENGEIKVFCVEESDSYDIVMNGTDDGTMDYAIRYFDSEEKMVDERIFEDVPLTENTVITTGSDQTGGISLEVDHDNDGSVDEVWTANKGEWITVPDTERICMTGLNFHVARDTICAGETLTLETEAYPANTTDRYAVSYTSSDESVAVVSENGEVEAIKPGHVQITATASNGYTAQIGITVSFSDVPKNEFYFNSVLWALDEGITSGTSTTEFSPYDSCLRSQVVTFLWRAAGKPAPTSNVNPFEDVKPTDYYYNAVLWAVENGITYGADDTHFEPNGVCNRSQVVSFLYRAFEKPPVENADNPFTDVPAGAWYATAVRWAVQEGIAYGLSESEFGPNEVCNRSQVVTFLYRAYN